MKMNEKVLNALKELGFIVENVGDTNYCFQYEGNNYLYMYNETDESFLNIAIPNVLQFNDENELYCHRLMEGINNQTKYVKAYKYDDSVWLFYELELSGNEKLRDVLSRIILRLAMCNMTVEKILSEKCDSTTNSADSDDLDE